MRSLLPLLLAAGCATSSAPAAPATPTTPATAPTPAAKPPPVVTLLAAPTLPGERIAFELTFRGIGVGLVETTVGQPGRYDDRTAVIIQSRATGTGVVEMITNYIGELTTTADFAEGFALAMRKEEWFEVLGKPHHDDYERTYPRDEQVHDLHTGIHAIRAWRSRPGDRAKITLTVAAKKLDLELVDAGRAIHPYRNTPAVRYTGAFDCGCEGENDMVPFTLWISDDAARVPLRIHAKTRWGTARAELAAYSSPME